MMFEEHLQEHRNDDGSYNLAAAENARADEIAETPGELRALAVKAAKQERARWESNETANLRKQFAQPALSAELEVDVMVPLGESVAVRYGEMDLARIRIRRDLRLEINLRENRAHDIEQTHWLHTEKLLHAGQTIAEALGRTISS